jgi:hypothetical protein
MPLPTEMIERLEGTSHPRWYGGVGALIVLVGAVGLFSGIDALRASPPSTAFGIVGIGGFVVAIAIMAVVGKLVARRLIVDADGVEVRTRGGDVTRIRWSEPHELYTRAIGGSLKKVSVRAPDGRRIDVDSVRVPGNPNAGVPAFVEHRSTAAAWPAIAAQLAAGQDVAFGKKVRLSRARVQIGRTSIAREARIAVRVHQGKLELKGARGSASIWVRQVANFPCLMRALADG